HAGTGHFPLDREIPLLVLRIVVLRRRRTGALSEEPGCVAARRRGQTYRPRILPRRELGAAAVEAPLDRGLGESKSAADLALHGVARDYVEKTVGSADRGPVVECVRDSKARLNVVPVAIVQGALVFIGEAHGALQPVAEEGLQRGIVGDNRG